MILRPFLIFAILFINIHFSLAQEEALSVEDFDSLIRIIDETEEIISEPATTCAPSIPTPTRARGFMRGSFTYPSISTWEQIKIPIIKPAQARSGFLEYFYNQLLKPFKEILR